MKHSSPKETHRLTVSVIHSFRNPRHDPPELSNERVIIGLDAAIHFQKRSIPRLWHIVPLPGMTMGSSTIQYMFLLLYKLCL